MASYRSFATSLSQLKICDFQKKLLMVFYEYIDDTTALQRRVLQTAL